MAVTGTAPIDDEGTVKFAENCPVELVVMGDGLVAIAAPLNVMVTVELGSNPTPAISTDVPTGPEAGSRKMIGFTKAVTVNVFDAELDP